ncbi:hypothetical protein FQN57_002743 [Myotisia sp. PD_48]|nr:hypothetical protein FQN57_002743 [Myotisia sp. PD_48]
MTSNIFSFSKLLALALAIQLARVNAGACPNPRLAAADGDFTVNPAASCPNDHGQITKAHDGTHFRLLCCAHENTGVTAIRVFEATTMTQQECVDKCISDEFPECNSVRYRTLSPKQCILYKNGGYSTAQCGNTDEHNFLYTIDPPAIKSASDQIHLCSTECPQAHGQKYTEQGKLFHLECGKRHGVVPFKQETKDSYRDCIDGCAAIPKCSNVDYSNRTSTCYYGTHSGVAPIVAPGYMSAYSLGCASACEKEEDCGCGGKKGAKVAGKDEL